MKFTQIPTNTFKTMQMNAGILLKEFDPTTATVSASDIIAATTGGSNFAATPAYTDLGEDVDNCPKNMMELKQLESWEAKLTGTMVTIDESSAKSLIAAAEATSSSGLSTITPRNDLEESDFDDIWLVGDYSEYNGSTNGGFVAIELKNALSTGGFQIKTADKAKGQFAFEYTAHYSMAAQDVVPFAVYIKAGTAEATA